MRHANMVRALVGVLLSVVAAGAAAGWEIRLKSEVATAAPIVRLGDVADIAGLDPQDTAPLQQIVVAPGPTNSHSRTVTVSDIRRLMESRGVDLIQCQFSGSPRVVVAVRGGRPASIQPYGGDVQRTAYRTAARGASVDLMVQQVEELAMQQFVALAGDSVPWTVAVAVPPRTDIRLPAKWTELTVEGIDRPREGVHQLTACVATDAGEIRVPLSAQARRMRPVVVPVRDVEKGRVIRAGDVQLSYVEDENAERKGYGRLEDVVGRQARQTVKAGRPVDSSSVVEPLLIKRRDTIEVININGAITVRRPALALEDGARGDSISVETLDGSKVQFVARVIGMKMAEAVACSPRVERHVEQLP